MKIYKLKSKNAHVGIKRYSISKNKVCISRKSGGYGDILMSRMIFQDLKTNLKDFEITYAIPRPYFQVLEGHPYIDSIKDCTEIAYDDYLAVYDISSSCSQYEGLMKKKLDKNRSDIWANSIGLSLQNHNMFLPYLSRYKDSVYSNWKKHGYQDGQKIIAFSPRSAVQIRNIIDTQYNYICKLLKRDDVFFYILNHVPILDLYHLPFCKGSGYAEAMAYICFSDAVVTTDTGTLHCAGGYDKPTVGLFNYTNGKIVGKYYSNLIIIQKTEENDSSWNCGPCNNYTNCPFEISNNTLMCMKQITNEMIDDGISKLYKKLGLKH